MIYTASVTYGLTLLLLAGKHFKQGGYLVCIKTIFPDMHFEVH